MLSLPIARSEPSPIPPLKTFMLAEVVSNEKPYLTHPPLKPKKNPKASLTSSPHLVENL